MRFSGRIRFEDVRDDLDALVEVTDTHVRLVSGEESLGSWCLSDVVANRLIADEFELDLDGEVVIFVADDQVSFAYGAVQRMAEGWARFHSMNLVRRKRAVAQARRQNDPNRLDSVRKAFVSARDSLRSPAVPLPTRRDETIPSPEEESDRPATSERPPVDPEPVQANEPEPASASRFWDRVEKATAADADAPADDPREPTDQPPDSPAETSREPGGPRPGRLRRLDAFPRPREDPGRPSREETGPETPAEEPDESPAEKDGPGTPTGGTPQEVRFDVPTGQPEAPPDQQKDPTPEPVSPRRERRRTQETVEVRVDLDQPAEEALVPAEVPSGGPSSEPDNAQRRAGAYRGGRHPSETSGWRAGLRSLFSRSDGEHEHSFVESTTPAGITRRVCLDCGHVSIGVSDDAS